MQKAFVKVLLKKDVLDVKGRAVLQLLQREKFPVSECRFGKYIELSVEEKDPQKALHQARLMAEKFLCNPLTETCAVGLQDPASSP